MALLKSFGGGIAAPSANRFCRISPTQALHVYEELGNSVDIILDGGACQVGVESTIIDLSGNMPRLLRPGLSTRQEIADILKTDINFPQASKLAEIRTPGMMEVHYAPSTPAMLCPAAQLPDRIRLLQASGKKCGLLSCQLEITKTANISVLRLPQQANAYARQFYAALRKLDRLQLDFILVEQPLQTEPWQAINDRLRKATAAYSHSL